MRRLTGQNAAVLAWLRSHPSTGITPKDAYYHLTCFRLAARIAELRAMGFTITTDRETHNGATFARYRLVES